MQWMLSKAASETPIKGGEGTFDQIFGRILALTRIQDLIAV
jgi:hypothetical protein